MIKMHSVRDPLRQLAHFALPRARRAFLVLLVSLLFLDSNALATPALDLTTRTLVVTFESGHLTCEPTVVSGKLRLTTAVGTEIVDQWGIVVGVQSFYPRGSEAQSINGPWLVTVVSSVVPAAIQESELTIPWSLSCEVIAASDDSSVGMVPVSGESAVTHFPTDPAFCEWQNNLHANSPVEGPIAGEPCDPETTSNWVDMDLPQAHAISRGNGILVAVIDTGVEWTHSDLGGAFSGGPFATTGDSMMALSGGVIVPNIADPLGDLNGDGAPGILNVDDDNDGLIDEDRIGLGKGNQPESDLFVGTRTATGED